MNELTTAIALLMLPGIVSVTICDRIAFHSEWSPLKFGIYIFLLGILSYTAMQVLVYVYDIFGWLITRNLQWYHLDVWKQLSDKRSADNITEIFWSVIISIPVAFAVTGIVNYKVLNRIGQWMRVTFKYGDENLYSYYLNLKEVEWVWVRDPTNDLTYQGKVSQFSENKSIQELVLSDVSVYSYLDSKLQYEVPSLYLTKKHGEMIIEAVPSERMENNDGQKKNVD